MRILSILFDILNAMNVAVKKYILLFFAVAICIILPLCGFSAYADEAERNIEKNTAPVTVTVVADGKEFVYSDEKIIASDFSVEEEMERRRINAPLGKKIELVDMLLSKGADYECALNVCFPRLASTVDAVEKYLFVPSVNSEVKYSGGKFRSTRESSGRALDKRRLYAGIYCCLKFSGGGRVDASTVTLLPDVTKSENDANLILKSSYTTDFSASTSSRAHNITLALKKMDGVCIAAGQTLSFNAAVGARTESNGFESAKIIVDGQYTDGVGGGVCQASTAVYNAALLAGLHCGANAHSICPSYCPPGLDAMISSMSDLTVTNTTGHAVYISVSAYQGKATVKIYGEPNVYDIVPESVVVKTIEHECKEITDVERKYFDATAQSGDRLLVSPGKDGVISETYLKYYKSGALVKRVKIRTNEYKTAPQIIAVAP